jgi:hypothetical protein
MCPRDIVIVKIVSPIENKIKPIRKLTFTDISEYVSTEKDEINNM